MLKKTIISLLCIISILLMSSCSSSPGLEDMEYAPKSDLSEMPNEEYNEIVENDFIDAKKQPKSSFSLDTSTYAYSNIRRLINDGVLVNADAVVIEQMLNYFNYSYVNQTEDALSSTLELGICPWNPNNYLAAVAVKAKDIELADQANNFVLLIDVSGSMNSENKIGLLRSSFKLFVDQLGQNDTVSIVTYASGVSTVIDGVNGSEKTQLLDAISSLEASGGTNGSGGIQRAYELARKHFVQDGNNRVLLATDGDFNVGLRGNDLIDFISEKRASGIYLSTFGYGMGNTNHKTMEDLAVNGNGNAYYIDSLLEAKKVFVNELGGTMLTVAKDAKAQVEFNPEAVNAYRLLGYENKQMSEDEFNDSNKDAGEIGSGHTTIAMFEIVPTENFLNSEFIFKSILRYKTPETNEDKEVINNYTELVDVTDDFEFASFVVEFALLLRDSKYKGEATYEHLQARIAEANVDGNTYFKDDFYRLEFVGLVNTAKRLYEESLTNNNQ